MILDSFLRLVPLMFGVSTSIYTAIICNKYSQSDTTVWLALVSVSMALSVFGLIQIGLHNWKVMEGKITFHNYVAGFFSNMKWIMGSIAIFYVVNIAFTAIVIKFITNPASVAVSIEDDKLKGSYGNLISIFSYVSLGIGAFVFFHYASTAIYYGKNSPKDGYMTEVTGQQFYKGVSSRKSK